MRPRELAGVLAVVLATTVGPISGQEEHLEILRGKLQVELEEIVAAYEGVAGLHVVFLLLLPLLNFEKHERDNAKLLASLEKG
jgi:hypothetical protein